MNRQIHIGLATLVVIAALFIAAQVVWFFAKPDVLIYQNRQEYGSLAAKQPTCDPSLWQHVYTGDLRKFSKPQDRLKIIKDCVQVTGTIETAIKEPDGDFHIRLKLDPQYTSMLNAKNLSGQRGDLVLEPVCENTVTQSDTLKEGACNGYVGHVYNKSMLGKHVTVFGPYVTDMEHGWNEIHFVQSITIK